MNRRSLVSSPMSFIGITCALLVAACGGGQSEPQSPEPAPAATPATPVAPAPVASTSASAEPTPAPPPAAPAEDHKRHQHHGMAAMLLESVRSLELTAEQKTAVEGIESDLAKLGDAHKDAGKKLGEDIADGVALGKIDHKKTDADVAAIAKAIEGTIPTVQDAVNRLHKTLTPEQRKQLVDAMNEKAAKMQEHMAEHEHGMMGHGPDHEKGEKGGPDKAGAGKGPEKGEHDHDHGKGGPNTGKHEGGMGEHHEGGMDEHHGPGMGGHGMHHEFAEALGLTPEQQEKLHAKLEADMKAQQGAMKQQMDAMKKHMEAIGKAFATDKFDAKKAGVGQQGPAMAKKMAANRVKFAETVLSVLTPEQRAKFATHIREHVEDPD